MLRYGVIVRHVYLCTYWFFTFLPVYSVLDGHLSLVTLASRAQLPQFTSFLSAIFVESKRVDHYTRSTDIDMIIMK